MGNYYLLLSLSNINYAIDLDYVKEVTPNTQFTNSFHGSLRIESMYHKNELINVFDLATLVGIEQSIQPLHIVMSQCHEDTIGLSVDDVHEVISANYIEDLREAGEKLQRNFITHTFQYGSNPYKIINLEKIHFYCILALASL